MKVKHAGTTSNTTDFDAVKKKTAASLEEVLLHGKDCASNAIYLYTSQLSQEGDSPPSQK